MKKHELLKFAYDNYPKGTKFKQERCEEIRTASGNYAVNNVTVYDIDLDLALYIYSESNEEWAEIVKPKIAVKVENEKEFKVLMKYYDSLGYVWNGGDKPLSKESLVCYPNAIKFEDKFQHSVEKESIGYQIIPFSAFAKDHNIKLPLLTSEDGFDLYEGDEYFRVGRSGASADGDWKLFIPDKLTSCHFVCCYKETDKAFKYKKNALDWIEAQNPKTIYIECGHEFIALVDKNRITWQGDKPNIITKETIVKIYNAMQELS